jgi:hypothetical protein
MKDLFIEIDSEKFNNFLVEVFPKHHSNSEGFLHYIMHRKMHGLDAFQKNYLNEVLENYYGIHYTGISVKNKDNYTFSVVDKKLCSFLKIKFEL